MGKRKKEKTIDEQAEEVALDAYPDHRIIDPYYIANLHNIKVVGGNYEDYFKGLIQYKKGKFRIFLNLDILENPQYEFARYTCSHELAHAFLREHRELLMGGQSLAFKTGKSNCSLADISTFEKQAQEFAAGLLMPKKRFIDFFGYLPDNENTLEFIFSNLKAEFQTSLTSTAVRFIELGSRKCVFFRIGEKFWPVPSPSFSAMFRIRPYFMFNPNRNKNVHESRIIQPGGYKYEISYLNLSSWIERIPVGTSLDKLVKEEIIYTDRYAFCLLTVVE